VDWRTGIADAVREFAAEHGLALEPVAFADSWRGRYAPSMALVRAGERPFVSLDVLHRENLDEVLSEAGIDPGGFTPGVLDGLARAWHVLPPWPDSVAGIAELKRHYIVGPLSNGNTSLLLDMARAAGLPWDLILGSDVTRAYKPDPAAYIRPAGFLGIEPAEIMLAAAHSTDLTGARAAGLATAFISRPAEYGERSGRGATPAGDWDVAATSITGLAAQLSAGRQGGAGLLLVEGRGDPAVGRPDLLRQPGELRQVRLAEADLLLPAVDVDRQQRVEIGRVDVQAV
jgi:2-haloacid dehalogenase